MKIYEGTPNAIHGTMKFEYFYNIDFASENMKSITDVLIDEFGEDFTYEEAYFYIFNIMGITNTATLNFAIVQANSKHAKIFTFSSELKKALKHTKLPKRMPEIRLPFKSIIIDEWTFIEKDGHIRGVRCFKTASGLGNVDFIKIESQKDYNEVRERCGLLINMLLYLTSEKPELEHAERNPSKIKGTKRGIRRNVIYVGRRYSYLGRVESRAGIHCRFAVRGHWRQQYIKDGHKRIFIEPHWRGPDMAEVVNKTYKVV